jgi:transcriptional regulator with XRE-family HTH domain
MIDNLKQKLGCDNDQNLAELLGVGRNTIARMKKGEITKITEACKVIDVLTDEMTAQQRRACIRRIHYGDHNNASRSNTMFVKNKYEKFSDALETSAEILFAIEQVAGDYFEYIEDEDVFGDKTEEINENTDAYELWENGGRNLEILAALPTENGGSPIEDGTEVFWGMEGKFAEFYGEKWIMEENF